MILKKEKNPLHQNFWTFLSLSFFFFFFFLILRLVKKTTWNQTNFKFVRVYLKSLCYWPQTAFNFPQPVVRLIDRYDSNTKGKGGYYHWMNLAVLPDYSSTRVVTFVVAVFFGSSPSSKAMIFAMASGHSFAASCHLFWRFCCWSITISSFQHYADQGKNEHKGHEGQR